MTVTAELTCEELLNSTRTVRKGLDLGRDVELETVEACLRLALQAPNGGDRQQWRWLVLTDPDLRAEVARVYREAFRRRNAVMLDRLSELDPATMRLATSARYLAENLHKVPVLVIPCLELSSGQLPEGNQAGLWGSLLPAAWSYQLAARTRGLATAWTSVHLDREQEVAELLGLPPAVRQGGLLPTAHSLKSGFRPAPRQPLEEVMHVNGWAGRRS